MSWNEKSSDRDRHAHLYLCASSFGMNWVSVVKTMEINIFFIFLKDSQKVAVSHHRKQKKMARQQPKLERVFMFTVVLFKGVKNHDV